VFSPVDVFSTVSLTDLSFKRSGSDVVTARFPVGPLGGVDAVAELPAGRHDNAALVKAFGTVRGWDLSLVGIYRQKSRTVIGGLAFKGDALVGLCGEAVTLYDRNDRQWAFEAMAGADYSVRSTWFFAAEYMYGERRDVANPLRDWHNLYDSVRFVISDLMSVAGVVIATVPDRHALATVQYAWNILQSVDTVWYLRYYRLGAAPYAPDGEGGLRLTVKF